MEDNMSKFGTLVLLKEPVIIEQSLNFIMI